ncbi:Ig-like domain-containing protein [Geodermatophilus arenarius]|uniref:Ig-like domain-containing protein n=1 Tax=Geodermatophilus arenarius TaxID=1137990 RepID=A0ABV9LDH5_9ACTN
MRRTAALVTAGALVLLSGCQGGDDAGSASASSASSASSAASTSADAAPAQLQLAPADGAVDVAPADPVEISVTDGDLADVAVTDGAGADVPGQVADGDTEGTDVWTPDQDLAYASTYTLTATATNADGERTEARSTFTTVDPETVTTPSIGPLDGQTVGVGMPIRVYFEQPVADKAAAESHLLVTSSNPTDGVWSWLSDTEVHFRPSQYWPAQTDVTLEADLYGVHLGDGIWGEKDRTVSFRIGDRHVSVADAATHRMRVYDGDRLVQDWPMSAGSPDNPSYNGPHVVTELNADRVMDSSTYGVPVDSPEGYRTPVKWAVRISDSGEFVHGAPWSVAQQGRENVSHGCINLSDENARWFYEFSQPGDVVEIVNSDAGPLTSPIADWTIPWDQWQAGSALR